MDDLIGFVVGIAVVVGIIWAILAAIYYAVVAALQFLAKAVVFVLQLALVALAGVLLAIESLALGVVLLLDAIFGASLVPAAPWIPWLICGALIGGAAAVSSFADRLGWNGVRASLPVVGVLVLLTALAFLP